MSALCDLPPAVLQVIVPLIGLHDPAAAHLLPSVGRADGPSVSPPATTSASQHGGSSPASPSESPPSPQDGWSSALPPDASVHTGREGCAACLPSVRTRVSHPAGPACRQRESSVCEAPNGAHPWRRLWVGELLGPFRSFVSPADVRRLALSPGTTMSRLLVDPADGRCVERSTSAYLMDAAMRAQILAADVTCRAPGCVHPAVLCQIDHVEEFGAGGPTSESNGQPLHTGHHDPKTAKDWDAHLAANRDVTWTTLLGRVYRTRAWDYRRYVTALTDAVDSVSRARPEDLLDTLNREVYLALTHRELGERVSLLDDPDPDAPARDEWDRIELVHTDPVTGRRVRGPSAAAVAHVLSRAATGQPLTAPEPLRAATMPQGAAPEPPRAARAQDSRGWPAQDARCTEPGHDHPQWVGPYDYHHLVPPPRRDHEEWSRHIAARLAAGEDCPPF